MENKVLDIRANKGGLCVGKNRTRKNDRWRERNTDICCWDKHKQPLCISVRYTNTFTVQSQVQSGSIAHSWPPPEGVFKRKYSFLCWRPPRVLRGRRHTSRSEEADSHLSSQRLPGECTRVSLEPRSCWMLRFWRAQADDLQRSKLCVREWTFPATNSRRKTGWIGCEKQDVGGRETWECCGSTPQVRSHFPLFCDLLWVKSSHFNRNHHDWEFHMMT